MDIKSPIHLDSTLFLQPHCWRLSV